MMEANHSRWQKLRSPHSTNPVQRAIPAQLWLYATLKVSKLHDVCLRSFVRCFIPPLQQVCTPFQQVFALFLLFSEKTHLGVPADLHNCLRRNMATQSFTEGGVDDSRIMRSYGIYTIHN